MPESADEAMMASDDIRDDTKALLAKAAALWADGGVEGGSTAPPGRRTPPRAGHEVGDRIAFVTAYYRRVAPEDLIAAGPDRLAETVARHAALGASRPQGRPAVGVRPAQSSGGAVGALTSAGTVVDIVTDDMPYLVDSVTMELNRHAADIRLIVHPVLTVRRDVAGTAHGIALAGDGSVSESWIHVELGQVADEQRLAEDLRRVLDDLRVAMEDQRRMRGAARELVAVLTDEGGSEEAEASELLAWLAAGHFTFLGYRKYDLVRSGEGDGAGRGRAQARPRHRTRHPPARRHRLVRRHPAQGPGGRAPGAAAGAGQVVHPVHRLPAQVTSTTWRFARSASRPGR